MAPLEGSIPNSRNTARKGYIRELRASDESAFSHSGHPLRNGVATLLAPRAAKERFLILIEKDPIIARAEMPIRSVHHEPRKRAALLKGIVAYAFHPGWDFNPLYGFAPTERLFPNRLHASRERHGWKASAIGKGLFPNCYQALGQSERR